MSTTSSTSLTWNKLADLFATYGPAVIQSALVIVQNIEAGKGEKVVSAADLTELNRLQSLTADSIWNAEGVMVPVVAQVPVIAPVAVSP